MTESAVLEIHAMSKRYGTKTALDEIELYVKPGEVVGLIGPNGAGKTTLMECAIGITKPTSGHSRIMNHDTWVEHTQASRHFGVQFQTTELPPFTRVSDTFWFFRRVFAAHENPRTLCAEFGLDESHYHSFFRTLSGGERRRVLIALAFLGNPPIVLLDEPTAGMDPGARSQFWEAVRRRRDAGRSIVCSSHALEDMEVNCDRVAFLVDGTVRASGKVADIVERFGAFMTYVIAAPNPQLLLSTLKEQIGGTDGIVWYGQVQGRILIITSRALAEPNLARMSNRDMISHKSFRKSNLEDIYHVCMADTATPGETR